MEEFRGIDRPTQIGKVRIETVPGKDWPVVTIVLNENAVRKIPHEMLPPFFDVNIDRNIGQNQYIFSHRRDSGYVRLMGRIICDAQITSKHEKMVQCQVACEKSSAKPKAPKILAEYEDLMIDKKPSMRGVDSRRPKKEVKDKRIRKSEQEMRLLVLQAFKEKSDWKVKELAALLDQSQDYCQTFVKEIADYDAAASCWRARESAFAVDE
jgi:hypothetical protein